MRFISIDPGLGGTGVALFDYCEISAQFELVNTHSFSRKGMANYLEAIGEWVSENGFLDAEFVAIEKPTLMGGQKGTASARSGSLVELTLFAGSLAGYFHSLGIGIKWIPISSWKGNLPKEITTSRILTALPHLPRDKASHYYDAIGIGLFTIDEISNETK